MSRSSIETGQPTPEQVIDALSDIPDHELAEAVAAQTDHDVKHEEALNKMTAAFQDAVDDIVDFIPDEYNYLELRDKTRILSDAIPILLGLSEDKPIPDIIENKPGHFVKHWDLPDQNHAWRVVAPDTGTLELRTGPFYDTAVNTHYEPELKFTLRGVQVDHHIEKNGRKSFVGAVTVINLAKKIN